MIRGDINIDTNDIHHPWFRSVMFLVKDKTCFTKNHCSSIDVILTNNPRCFQNMSVFESGLSDFHGLVLTLLKIHIPRLKPKIVKYRSYKKFALKNFCKMWRILISKQIQMMQICLIGIFHLLFENFKINMLLWKLSFKEEIWPLLWISNYKGQSTLDQDSKRLNNNPTQENRRKLKSSKEMCFSKEESYENPL